MSASKFKIKQNSTRRNVSLLSKAKVIHVKESQPKFNQCTNDTQIKI